MATLIEHGDYVDLRDVAQAMREALDDWASLSGDEQATVRNTADAVRQLLADLGIRQPGSPYTQVDVWAADALEEYANDEPTLIAADYFTTYAQELAEDIGAYNHHSSWPLNHIDWKAAADELRSEYGEVTFDGHDYLIRSV